MNVLMISIDKGLLGQGQMGDVCERHKKYGEFCPPAGGLDIIVLNKKKCHPGLNCHRQFFAVSGSHKISNNVIAYPTNSRSKLFYYFDALKIGKKLFAANPSAGSGQVSYDLIVCQDPFITGLVGLKLKQKFNSKLLVHFHGDFKFPFWRVVKNADAIRVMSPEQKEKLIKKGVPAEKIYVISTPIDLERFDTQGDVVPSLLTGDTVHYRSSQETGANQKEKTNKTLLFVGRLEPVKNLSWFFDIFKSLITNHQSIVTLKIIGTGSQENKLKELAKELNISDKVEFLGQLPQDKIIDHYYNADIVILPSLSESFGKVLVEANACAKPVVATATTGAKEIIQDGVNGFLVPIGNTQALAEKIIYLLDNPELARQIGENGRKIVMEKFNGVRQLERIKNMWQKIIKI